MASIRFRLVTLVVMCCHYVNRSTGVNLPPRGIIFFGHESISVSDFRLFNFGVRLATNLSYHARATSLCHDSAYIHLYWTDPTNRIMGRIIIKKKNSVLVEQRVIRADVEVLKIQVTPSNSILFLDKGSELSSLSTKTWKETRIRTFSMEEELVDLFIDNSRSYLYYLEALSSSRLILHRIGIDSSQISKMWQTDSIKSVQMMSYDPESEKLFLIDFRTVWCGSLSSSKFKEVTVAFNVFSSTAIPGWLIVTAELTGELQKINTKNFDATGPGAPMEPDNVAHLVSYTDHNFHKTMGRPVLRAKVVASSAFSVSYSEYLLSIFTSLFNLVT